MMSFIACAPASRTALTDGLVTVTPRLMRATSGTIVTLPLPDTVMVCCAGVASAAGAPASRPGRRPGAAAGALGAPTAPAPGARARLDTRTPIGRPPPGTRARVTPGPATD